MKPDFSDGRVLGLVVILAAIGVAALVASDPRTVPSSGAKAAHTHPEMDHSSPEAQRRMAIYHYNEGNQHLKAGQWTRAVDQYEMALAHSTELPQVYLNLSTAMLKQKKFKEALSRLRRLEQLAPDLPELHYNLACYFALTGNLEEGVQALENAFRKGYNNRADLDSDPDLEALRPLPRFKQLRHGG